MRGSKIVTSEQMLQRMAALCARSEQCSADIEKKLRAKGLPDTDIRKIFSALREGKFLDDARFARAFTNDKVRFSGWGRRKIRVELMARRIPDSVIADALDQIDEAQYHDMLLKLAVSKGAKLDLTQYKAKMKLARYLAGRGFELDIVSKVVNNLSKQE